MRILHNANMTKLHKQQLFQRELLKAVHKERMKALARAVNAILVHPVIRKTELLRGKQLPQFPKDRQKNNKCRCPKSLLSAFHFLAPPQWSFNTAKNTTSRKNNNGDMNTFQSNERNNDLNEYLTKVKKIQKQSSYRTWIQNHGQPIQVLVRLNIENSWQNPSPQKRTNEL